MPYNAYRWKEKYSTLNKLDRILISKPFTIKQIPLIIFNLWSVENLIKYLFDFKHFYFTYQEHFERFDKT